MALTVKNKNDLFGGIAILLFGSVIQHQTRLIRVPELEASLGPTFFPNLISILLILLSLRMVFGALSFTKPQVHSQKSNDIHEEHRPHYSMMFFIICLSIGYLFLFSPLGFPLSTVIVLVTMLTTFKATNIIKSTIIAVAVVCLVWLLFSQIFGVALPLGSIWGF